MLVACACASCAVCRVALHLRVCTVCDDPLRLSPLCLTLYEQKRRKEMDAKYNMTRTFAASMAQAPLQAGDGAGCGGGEQLKLAGDQRQEFMEAFREIGALKAKPAAQYVLNMLEDPSTKLLVFAHHRWGRDGCCVTLFAVRVRWRGNGLTLGSARCCGPRAGPQSGAGCARN